MPYHIQPLYYAIDDWHQAVNAKSNTDPTLKIEVSDFVDSMVLQGTRIQVRHPQYGILFAALANANGRLVLPETTSGLTNTNIIAALKQLGFYIQFKNRIEVSGATRTFLVAARTAGYTHIRRALCIKGVSTQAWVICFNEVTHPELLRQYIRPLKVIDGDIMRVSPNDNPNLDFSWLFDIPLQIESVLTNNI